MAKTYEELLEQAAIIRDETAAGKNTATRVGGTITDAVDYVKELQDTYKGIHAEAAEAKTTAAAANTKNADQDGKISSLEAKDATHDTQIAKLEERTLQYIYPKIYQLNEGAGAIVFHGFTKATGEGGLIITKDTYRYSVLYSTTQKQFVLNVTDEASGAGVRVGTFTFWPKISLPNNKSIASSESYALRDCLYYIYVEGEGSTYYYIDSNGVASEKSATYLLRRLVDKNASSIAAASGTANDAKATAEAAKATADAASTAAQEAKSAAETAQTAANSAQETANSARETATAASTAAQEAKSTAETAQTAANSAQETANSASLNATAANSTANEAKAKAEAAQESANTAQQTADAAQTKNADQDTRIAALLQDIPWEGYHMNAFTDTGEYHIHGESTDANDGLPILNSGTIDARLTVLDSSLTNGTGEKTDIVVTQILRLSNRMGGDGHVYVRTAQAATKSQLATPSSTAWGTWEKLMGMFEKNAVTNIADLDTYTTNGMYSGLFANTTFQTLGGLKFTPGDTFLLITVNGYAASAFGTPQLTQMLYKLPSKKGSGNSSARMYLRTAYWDKNADQKAWVWANWDRLAMASEISGGGGGSIEDYNTLIELIAANTTKIETVERTANSAKSAAENAQTAADTAQETANSAQETATAASTAAQEAKSAAETAQSAATAAQTKNTEQDARLDNIEARIDPDIAGRVWNEDNGTPKAESYYGSVKALRDLPKRLGLGRYIVKDDRTRRKLDPNDSRKYLDDGSTANLDGTDGQCMWCWNGFYANIWHEGSRLIKAVTFDGPVGNDISIWIPAGGISWLGAGVMDRTEQKLCSVISEDERYRGGGGTAIDASKYSKAPADTTPQITMLGMPATNISTTNFGTYARKRGEGWEANWFVARFVVEFLFEVIMGTENSQEAFNANKDANGLYQGGFGMGVTDMKDWNLYNGSYPIIPTSVGLEAGDGVCLVEYNLPNASGGTYHTFNVPVFFGLVGAGFGMGLRWVRGLIIDVRDEKSLVYVAPSMYAAYDPNTVEGKIMVAECAREGGFITRKSYSGLCCMPTEVGGSQNIRYSDNFFTVSSSKGLRVSMAGGPPNDNYFAGESSTFIHNTAAFQSSGSTSPLCYFEEDPIIPDSQSIVQQ